LEKAALEAHKAKQEAEKKAGVHQGPHFKGEKLHPYVAKALEMAKLLFEKYDTDKNGFIDEAEMKQILEDSYRQMGIPKVFTKEELDIFFDLVDENRDGKISLEEY